MLCAEGAGGRRELQHEPAVVEFALFSFCNGPVAMSMSTCGFCVGETDTFDDSGEPFVDDTLLMLASSPIDGMILRELGLMRSSADESMDCLRACPLLLAFFTRCAVLVGDCTTLFEDSSSILTGTSCRTIVSVT